MRHFPDPEFLNFHNDKTRVNFKIELHIRNIKQCLVAYNINNKNNLQNVINA